MIIDTFLLTIAVMYLYSVIIFYMFDDLCVPDTSNFYGRNLYLVFFSTFYFGLTQGGGVGDAIKQFSINESEDRYWQLYTYATTIYRLFFK